MSELGHLRAGIVGTGFVAEVHVDALRRLGVVVGGVVGSSPERAAAKSLGPVVGSLADLLADERIDVVHVTTPNDLHHPQVKQALRAGKHVVCEKPLAMTSQQSAELVELAEASGLVHCTNLNLRFYPLLQEARARVLAGDLGDVWDVHGGYLQDWLATPTDWNWRLEAERGGGLRAVGDIGSHWLDLAGFLTGLEIVEVFADLATVIPVRRRPVGEVETFASAEDVERVDAPMSTEDLAHVLIRFEGGARGSVVLSQVSAGRKNSLRIEVDGSLGSLAWDAERNEELWLGRRESPNATLLRNPALMAPGPAARTQLPAGHGEGMRTRSASSIARSMRTSRAAAPRRTPTTRPSARAIARTSSERRSPTPTVEDAGSTRASCSRGYGVRFPKALKGKAPGCGGGSARRRRKPGRNRPARR